MQDSLHKALQKNTALHQASFKALQAHGRACWQQSQQSNRATSTSRAQWCAGETARSCCKRPAHLHARQRRMQLGQALEVAAVPVRLELPVALHARLALRGAADARVPHAAPLLHQCPTATAQSSNICRPVRQRLAQMRRRGEQRRQGARAARPGARHEDERVARGDQRQQVGGRVLVVQHLHLALARARRGLPPHRRVAHLAAAARPRASGARRAAQLEALADPVPAPQCAEGECKHTSPKNQPAIFPVFPGRMLYQHRGSTCAWKPSRVPAGAKQFNRQVNPDTELHSRPPRRQRRAHRDGHGAREQPPGVLHDRRAHVHHGRVGRLAVGGRRRHVLAVLRHLAAHAPAQSGARA